MLQKRGLFQTICRTHIWKMKLPKYSYYESNFLKNRKHYLGNFNTTQNYSSFLPVLIPKTVYKGQKFIKLVSKNTIPKTNKTIPKVPEIVPV